MNYANPLVNNNLGQGRIIDRSRVYNAVALAYDRTRPRYTEAIISTAIELARLPDRASSAKVNS